MVTMVVGERQVGGGWEARRGGRHGKQRDGRARHRGRKSAAEDAKRDQGDLAWELGENKKCPVRTAENKGENENWGCQNAVRAPHRALLTMRTTFLFSITQSF